VAMERGKYYMGGKVQGLKLPTRVFPCASPSEVRATLPKDTDVLAFQCRNPIHRCSRWVDWATRAGSGGGERGENAGMLCTGWRIHREARVQHFIFVDWSRVCTLQTLEFTQCPHSDTPAHNIHVPYMYASIDIFRTHCLYLSPRAHYELFIRALEAPNVSGDSVCLVHPTCGPTQVSAFRNVLLCGWYCCATHVSCMHSGFVVRSRSAVHSPYLPPCPSMHNTG
jgi:hypothetical protein